VTRSIRENFHDLSNAVGGILVGAELGERRSKAEDDRGTFATLATGARRAAELMTALRPAIVAASEPVQSDVARDDAYVESLSPKMTPLLERTKLTCERDSVPLLDLASARLLAVLVTLAKPKSILELGTANGYSALWMAQSSDEAAIVTVEPDAGRAAAARALFREAGVADRIEIVERPALAVIADLGDRRFDLVFIDAVKTEYADYLEALMPNVRTGGLVVADNLLWSHRASTSPSGDDDPSTVGIRTFNTKFLSHPSLRAVILPVGDGVGVGVKIG
jgi:predicted O-methyltransferase YrrM